MSAQFFRISIFLLLGIELHAQDKLKGRILEIDSAVPLPNVRVSNVNSGQSVITDSAGRFQITAKLGHVIAFSLYSYQPDTVFLTELKDRDFFLLPVSHSLKPVIIQGAVIRPGSLVDKTSQDVTYQKSEDGTPKGGLVFRISYWNKDSRKERRSRRKLEDLQLQEEIDRVFNLTFIAQHTPLRGAELLDFRNLYRPSLALYESASFNLLLYLNDSYKQFKTLPPDKRKLPPLKVP